MLYDFENDIFIKTLTRVYEIVGHEEDEIPEMINQFVFTCLLTTTVKILEEKPNKQELLKQLKNIHTIPELQTIFKEDLSSQRFQDEFIKQVQSAFSSYLSEINDSLSAGQKTLLTALFLQVEKETK